jgi:hypothetical protein
LEESSPPVVQEPSAPTPPAPGATTKSPPPKAKMPSLPLIIAVIVIIGVVVAAAVYFAMPNLTGDGDDTDESFKVQNGDYIEYTVTGLALIIPIDGTMRIDFTNVTSEGYDMIMTTTGIPGADGTETTHHSFDDPLGSPNTNWGVKNGSTSISTTWGVKKVDMYVDHNATDNSNSTTYAGTNPAVVYRIDTEGDGFTMSVVLKRTNIEPIITGNV